MKKYKNYFCTRFDKFLRKLFKSMNSKKKVLPSITEITKASEHHDFVGLIVFRKDTNVNFPCCFTLHEVEIHLYGSAGNCEAGVGAKLFQHSNS